MQLRAARDGVDNRDAAAQRRERRVPPLRLAAAAAPVDPAVQLRRRRLQLEKLVQRRVRKRRGRRVRRAAGRRVLLQRGAQRQLDVPQPPGRRREAGAVVALRCLEERGPQLLRCGLCQCCLWC